MYIINKVSVADEYMDKTLRWLELDPSLPDRIRSLSKTYTKLFPNAPTNSLLLACAPGRAEILGNHTDYNEGYTLSANIIQNLLILGANHSEPFVEIASMDQGGSLLRFSLDSIENLLNQKTELGTQDTWSNYIKGVILSFKKKGFPVSGFSAVVQSTIPIGSGVSSSAAIEMALAHFLASANTIDITQEDLVPLCKDAENNYVGAPCGYLDQGTIALADNAWLKIDYRGKNGKPFQWEKIILDLKELGYALVVGFDKESKHEIVDGKYAVRQKTCKESYPVLADLLQRSDVTALRDISISEFEKVKEQFRKQKGDMHTNFSEHIIYDNERVLAAQKALLAKDLIHFGRLMTESGKSAIYLYDLGEGSPELSFVYETVVANQNNWGVLGVRNMGGGFNATTLALVKEDFIDKYKTSLSKLYKEKYNRQYSFLSFVPTPAAGILDMSQFK